MSTRRYILSVVFITGIFSLAIAQPMFPKEKIYSPFTIDNDAAAFRRAEVIRKANDLNKLPIGKDDESSFNLEVGMWGISQFRVRTPQSDSGIARLLKNYDALKESTQRALLEAAYALYPDDFVSVMKTIANKATHPRNFAMAALHVYRAQPNETTRQWVTQAVKGVQANEKQQVLLQCLLRYISGDNPAPLPPFDSLFTRQKAHGFKMVYSFQRANRDYPGLAIVQKPDGSFARDSMGQLKVFVQTPNLQSAMMHEVTPAVFAHYFPIVYNAPPEKIYRSYFPENWQSWSGLMEAYDAGRIGRGEIIAHGSTIDPEWFAGEPYYPLSPTLGCLSGLELWNKKTGRIDRSDQLDLVNTFLETKGKNGFLLVINLDDKKTPVSREEIEALVTSFELGTNL
ncbi:MAG: hypothetical protein MUE99_05100 [Chitinophagaceae bacterium]|nr:hypothetical protein [Chitinophagaceae bacterium]